MATPGKNKTNFKTYEASTRLLAAVIATNNVKLDYTELAKHVGGGATKDSINHRLRAIKQLAKMQTACVKNGQDPGDLPADKGVMAALVDGGSTKHSLEHQLRPIKALAKEFTTKFDEAKKKTKSGKLPATEGEIQKLFGESTPSGIEWQFRDIKNLGKAQQAAVKKGDNPATLPVPGTPSGRKKGANASTPGSGATRTPGTGPRSRGRKTFIQPVPIDSSDDNEGNNSDGDAATPSKRPAKRARTMAATPTPGTANGDVATPGCSPTKAYTSTPTVTAATPTAPATAPATDLFNNGGVTSTPRGAQTAQPIVKNEFMNGGNPFLGTMNVSAFDEGDHFEDGEI
ncbi:hypothetical protein F4678DRAFT_463135 [Xylaria arbuscula]|nr:hypothetical protein F4678DRAFT_463135 [Xylaria arbuscula]